MAFDVRSSHLFKLGHSLHFTGDPARYSTGQCSKHLSGNEDDVDDERRMRKTQRGRKAGRCKKLSKNEEDRSRRKIKWSRRGINCVHGSNREPGKLWKLYNHVDKRGGGIPADGGFVNE